MLSNCIVGNVGSFLEFDECWGLKIRICWLLLRCFHHSFSNVSLANAPIMRKCSANPLEYPVNLEEKVSVYWLCQVNYIENEKPFVSCCPLYRDQGNKLLIE